MNALKGGGGGGGVENQVFFVLPERVKILHNFAVALLSLFRVRDTSNLHESRRLNDVTNISCEHQTCDSTCNSTALNISNNVSKMKHWN